MPVDGTTHDVATRQIPEFPKRWWHRAERLDVRPVLWALRNFPEQFEPTLYCLKHKPSEHEFWVGNGIFFYSLYRTNGCSCRRDGERVFGFVQQFQFRSAYKAWLRWDRDRRVTAMKDINEQFRQHFIATATEEGKG